MRQFEENESLSSLSPENVERDVSVMMKYQQDQMILRALMYCIKDT